MKSRLRTGWQELRTSLWFVPLLMTASAGLLALLTTAVDSWFPELAGSIWLRWSEPQGAREILSTIAGSMITVAGVTFSITIVAMTLAASQFGPRILRSFMRDTGNQVVLGTFVATFLYCLLVLGVVKGGEGSAAIPQLSVTVAIVLAVASLGVLIYFVHHVSVSLQSEHLAAAIAEEMGEVIDSLFPARLGKAVVEKQQGPFEAHLEGVHSKPVGSPKSGYLQTIDNEGLIAIAESKGLLLQLAIAPGEFVTTDTVLVRASPPERCDDATASEIAFRFVLGRHRIPTQDVKYPLQQLTVIAVRALSSGINDPFTAVTCIDWIGSGLAQVADREIPSPYRAGRDGQVRVIAEPTTFPELADVALNPIRHSGARHVTVMLRLLETVDLISIHAERPEDRDSLQQHADRVVEEVRRSDYQRRDKEAVEALYREVTENLSRRAEPEDRGTAPASDRG